MLNDLITIGKIVKVWGFKGAVNVLPLTNNLKRFGRLLSVYMVSPEGKELKKEYLIPAIKEVIKEIDIKKKRMVIHPMEGLLD